MTPAASIAPKYAQYATRPIAATWPADRTPSRSPIALHVIAPGIAYAVMRLKHLRTLPTGRLAASEVAELAPHGEKPFENPLSAARHTMPIRKMIIADDMVPQPPFGVHRGLLL